MIFKYFTFYITLHFIAHSWRLLIEIPTGTVLPRFQVQSTFMFSHLADAFIHNNTQHGVQCPAYGHFDMWTGVARDRTISSTICGKPTMSPEPEEILDNIYLKIIK